MTQERITLLPPPAPDIQPSRWNLVFPLFSIAISIPAVASTWAIMYYSAESNRRDLLVLLSPFYVWAATPYVALVVLGFWSRRYTVGAIIILLGTLILAVSGPCLFYYALFFPTRSTSALVIIQTPMFQWIAIALLAGIWWVLFKNPRGIRVFADLAGDLAELGKPFKLPPPRRRE